MNNPIAIVRMRGWEADCQSRALTDDITDKVRFIPVEETLSWAVSNADCRVTLGIRIEHGNEINRMVPRRGFTVFLCRSIRGR
jgi:hypothetical protein